MVRYRFNITDGHTTAHDPEGADFLDLGGARAEATASVLRLLASSDGRGLCRRHWRMDVTDDGGLPVFSLPFGHALVADRLDAKGGHES